MPQLDPILPISLVRRVVVILDIRTLIVGRRLLLGLAHGSPRFAQGYLTAPAPDQPRQPHVPQAS